MNTLNQTLNVVEHFFSIQGEGSFCGTPSYFIRMGICPLRCFFCDSKFTWKKRNEEWSLESLYNAVLRNKCKHVVITGGEPFYRENYDQLVKMASFFARDFIVTIETTGIYDPEQIYMNTLFDNLNKFEKDILDYSLEDDIDEMDNIYFSISPKLNIEAYSECNNKVDISTVYEFYNLRKFSKKMKKFNYKYYYKFVYSSEMMDSIESFLNKYVPDRLLHDNIFIMPETFLVDSDRTNRKNKEEAAEFCKRMGVRYSPRIHVDIWGLQRGK